MIKLLCIHQHPIQREKVNISKRRNKIDPSVDPVCLQGAASPKTINVRFEAA